MEEFPDKLTLEKHPEQDSTVEDAIRRSDWKALRTLSLRPGGFGKDRATAWRFLAQSIERPSSKSEVSGVDDDELTYGVVTEHPDEHQIKLDTDRSFVLYSSEEERDRSELQSDLNSLITSVFRRHPKLNYFQGYHDIVTVIYLTMPESERLQVCKYLSLHRLRDAMGTGLEPIMALLRILKLLLRLADNQYSEILERNTPFPYFALSNLLTLFSHDVPTLPLAQHIFDYLLSRPPIASVYLAAVLALERKDEALFLEEGEEGMLHSLLSSLPELEDQEDVANSNSEILSSSGEEISADVSAPTGRRSVNDLEQNSEFKRDSANEMMIGDDDGSGKESTVSTESASRTTFADSTLDLLRTKRRVVHLHQVLKRTDDLLTQFPPTHPDLRLSSILGPQSVVFTWSEDGSSLLSDAEAEAIVAHPERVVLPYRDVDEVNPCADRETTTRRNTRQKLFFPFESKSMLITGVAVAGIAVAVYSLKSRESRIRAEELKRTARWLLELFPGNLYPL